jgi:hypothetical protein
MATKRTAAPVENQVPWDKRGVRLNSLEITFFASATPSAWRQLGEVVKMRLDADGPDAERDAFAASFTALPEQLEPGSLYLTGDVHPAPAPADKGNAHWHFTWRLAPAGEPPAQLKEMSQRVGGVAGIMANLLRNWPASKNVKVSVTVSYEVDKEQYKSFPGKVRSHLRKTQIKARDGNEHTLRPITTMTLWDIQPSIGPLGGLGIVLHKHVSTVIASGELDLMLDTNMLPTLDNALWDALSRLLPDAK